MTTWRARCLRGGPYRSLFIVAVAAYLLGVLTSPAARFTTSKLEQTLQPPAPRTYHAHVPRTDLASTSSSHVPLTGYRMLSTDLVTFHADCNQSAMTPERARPFLIAELFDGVSPYEGKEEAGLLEPERIKGWGSETPVFRRLIEEVRPRVIFELGSFLGASATHMGAIARELNLETDIFCVDDFRGWPGFRKLGDLESIKQRRGNVMLMSQFMQNVAHRNLSGTILPVPFGTLAALSAFCKWGIYADLIEVDASHDFHSAWADINVAFRLLRPGGVMFGHDYKTAADKRGVKRAVNLFARMNGLRVEPDGQHWIYRSKSR